MMTDPLPKKQVAELKIRRLAKVLKPGVFLEEDNSRAAIIPRNKWQRFLYQVSKSDNFDHFLEIYKKTSLDRELNKIKIIYSQTGFCSITIKVPSVDITDWARNLYGKMVFIEANNEEELMTAQEIEQELFDQIKKEAKEKYEYLTAK